MIITLANGLAGKFEIEINPLPFTEHEPTDRSGEVADLTRSALVGVLCVMTMMKKERGEKVR